MKIDLLYTTPQAAQYLGVHRATLARWTREGKVAAEPSVGRARMYRKSTLDKVLREREGDGDGE